MAATRMVDKSDKVQVLLIQVFLEVSSGTLLFEDMLLLVYEPFWFGLLEPPAMQPCRARAQPAFALGGGCFLPSALGAGAAGADLCPAPPAAHSCFWLPWSGAVLDVCHAASPSLCS